MAFKSIRDERTGRVVFRFDAQRNVIEIKARDLTGNERRRFDLSTQRDVTDSAPASGEVDSPDPPR